MPIGLSKQRPGDCEWCGKFIVLVESSPNDTWKSFEALRDDSGYLLQAYDGTLIYNNEHTCKARCSACGELVILEGGTLFERSAERQEHRNVHRCKQAIA